MKESRTTFRKSTWVMLIALTLMISSCVKTEEKVVRENSASLSIKSAVVVTLPVVSFAVANGSCGLQDQLH